jgi:hypothetical protein
LEGGKAVDYHAIQTVSHEGHGRQMKATECAPDYGQKRIAPQG